ncbi:MAG: PKD domain-containing protein [Pseudomonadota bacterium]
MLNSATATPHGRSTGKSTEATDGRLPRILGGLVVAGLLGGCPLLGDDDDIALSTNCCDVEIFQVTEDASNIANSGKNFRAVGPDSPIDAVQGELVNLELVVTVTARNQSASARDVTLTTTVEGALLSEDVSPGRENGVVAPEVKSPRNFAVQFRSGERDFNYSSNTVAARFEISMEDASGVQRTVDVPINILRKSYLPSATALVQVSAGARHSVALDEDGGVWAWGANDLNQVDRITKDEAARPLRVEVLENILSVSTAAWHTVALADDNYAWIWGNSHPGGENGPQPFGIPTNPDTLFSPVVELADAIAGINATYLIANDGRLYAMGSNESGRLGFPAAEDVLLPALIPVDPIAAIAVGENHVLALTAEGDVWGWGEAQSGQLGLGNQSTESSVLLPQKIADVSSIVDVAGAGDTSFLVAASGRVLVFGSDMGLADDNSPPEADSNFKYVAGVFDAIAVTANPFGESMILTRRDAGGAVYYSVYGSNESGQLTLNPQSVVSTLTDAKLPVEPTMISLGFQHGLLLQRDDSCTAVWSWGLNTLGRLGRSTPGGLSPESPAPLTDLGSASCAILTLAAENGGEVVSNPGNILCGTDCSDNYARGSSVMIDATQQASIFQGLDGACSMADGSLNSALPASIAMDGHKYCPAIFGELPGNIAPVARLTLSPVSPVEVGTVVTFDGSASSDEDGNIVTWNWDLDGDQMTDNSGEIINFAYQTAGYRAIRLTVTDNDGLTAFTEGVVDVVSGLSAPPVAAFTISPSASEIVGTSFGFDASASTDDVGIAGYSWDFNNDGSFEASGDTASYAPPAVGDYEILLRVTDTDGQFTDLVQTVTARPASTGIQYTLRIVITGSGQIDVPGYAGPLPGGSNCDGNECFIRVDEGTVLTVDASPIAPATFQGWSSTECDSVPTATRCVVTMNSERTVTATFQ